MSTDRTTEILNYLSAISRDVGELRAEMRAKFEQANTRFDEVRTDIRHLARKIEVMNQDLLELRANQRDLEVRMDVLENK